VNYWEAIVLGIVQGITEFLPISSTAHLTAVSALLGYEIDNYGVTAFTALIQVGSIFAVLGFFWRDIWRLFCAWTRGLGDAEQRGADYRAAWVVIVGSLPIGLIGFALRGFISGSLRNLWVVVAALIGWSLVMWLAERVARQERDADELNMGDALVLGIVQCLALIPGVSRSGATISAGLFRGLDRVTATRLSFLMAIPSLLGAGAFQAISEYGNIATYVGWVPTIVATAIAFLVSVAAIAWLLRFVAKHRITVFIWYRLALAALIATLLLTGVLTAT